MKVIVQRNIGDTVWLMYNDQAMCGTVNKFVYSQFKSNLDYESIVTVERYYVLIGEKEVSCEKEQLFNDKESLIKSL